MTLFDLIDLERLKFQRHRRKPFRRHTTLLGVLLSHENWSSYGQQNYCGVCSWLLRDRNGGVDHLPGLGPLRAVSLKSSPLGLVAEFA
jgi:hypothetical protein